MQGLLFLTEHHETIQLFINRIKTKLEESGAEPLVIKLIG